MSEEKSNKIIAAAVINAIILLFIIVSVLIYQVVTISVMNARKNKLKQELHLVQQKYEYAEDILDRLQNDDEFLRIIEELGKLGEDVSGYLSE